MSDRKTRKPLPPSPDFVTIREVAAYCCVTESAVTKGTRRGAWPFKFLRRVQVGSRVLFTRPSFEHMRRVMKAAAEAKPADVLMVEGGRGERAA